MRVEDCSRKVLEVGEEVHRRSLQENFPTDARRKLLKEGFGNIFVDEVFYKGFAFRDDTILHRANQ